MQSLFKIPASFEAGEKKIYKLILKFILKCNGPKITKSIFKKRTYMETHNS